MARGRPTHATSPTRVRSTMRKAKALELRAEGLTWDEVAKQSGYKSPQAAQLSVRNALEATLKEPADHLRLIELQRLEMLQKTWFPKAVEGDRDAAAVVLKISERRSKLMGLDAPTQIQAIPPGMSREEAEAIVMKRLEGLQGDSK